MLWRVGVPAGWGIFLRKKKKDLKISGVDERKFTSVAEMYLSSQANELL